MARCLVTGHKGYIGSHIYQNLKDLDHDVIGIDLMTGHDINGTEGLKESSDGTYNSRWSNFKPEYIFHLACFPRVTYSIENPVRTMHNNVLSTSNVLRFAARMNTKRVIYSSSSSVVGNGNGPTNPYGLQKLVSEMECKLYSELYGLDTVSLRYFNVYSKDQEADGPYATAISNWMQYIRESKDPYITGDGTQRRDMLHVKDVVSANMFAMGYEGRFKGQNFDVGTGTNISLNEVKEIINTYFSKIQFSYISSRLGEVQETKADTKALKDIGWSTKITIEDGINECFKNLKEDLKC